MKILKIAIIFILACSFMRLFAKGSKKVDFKKITWQYNLPIGKKLIYSVNEHSEYLKSESGRTGKMTVWVAKQNQDQSYRLLILGEMTPYRIRDKDERDDYPVELSYGICDLNLGGNYRVQRGLTNLYFRDIFLSLPQDIKMAKAGWDSKELEFGEFEHYKVREPHNQDTLLTILINRTSPLDVIYEIKNTGSIYFHTQDLLPVLRVNDYKCKNTVTTHTVITLDSIVDFGADGFNEFERELDIYFEADSLYDGYIEKAEEKPEQATNLLLRAESTLIAVKQKITLSGLKQIIEQWTAGFASDSQYINETVRRRAAIIGKPATAWEAEDFQAKNHKLDDFKGKVLILDFWYKNCPWCIRSMPALKKIAENFKDAPVAVIGMNVDKKEDDALFAIDKLHLGYLNLKAGDVSKKYGVKGYPTMFIIDPKGNFYDMHIGYSPDLYDKLVKTIESALEKK